MEKNIKNNVCVLSMCVCVYNIYIYINESL